MSSSIESAMNTIVPFYIKQAYTDNHTTLHLSANLTVAEFIYQVKSNLALICDADTTSNDFDVVEAGQNTGPHVNAEDAPKLVPETITMAEKYGARKKYVAFYVRHSVTR
jgi:hypothetical protein